MYEIFPPFNGTSIKETFKRSLLHFSSSLWRKSMTSTDEFEPSTLAFFSHVLRTRSVTSSDESPLFKANLVQTDSNGDTFHFSKIADSENTNGLLIEVTHQQLHNLLERFLPSICTFSPHYYHSLLLPNLFHHKPVYLAYLTIYCPPVP